MKMSSMNCFHHNQFALWSEITENLMTLQAKKKCKEKRMSRPNILEQTGQEPFLLSFLCKKMEETLRALWTEFYP